MFAIILIIVWFVIDNNHFKTIQIVYVNNVIIINLVDNLINNATNVNNNVMFALQIILIHVFLVQ